MSRERKNLIFALLFIIAIPFTSGFLCCGGTSLASEGARKVVAATPTVPNPGVGSGGRGSGDGTAGDVLGGPCNEAYATSSTNPDLVCSVDCGMTWRSLSHPGVCYNNRTSGGSSSAPVADAGSPKPVATATPKPTKTPRPTPKPDSSSPEAHIKWLHKYIFNRRANCSETEGGLNVSSWADRTLKAQDLIDMMKAKGVNPSGKKVYVYDVPNNYAYGVATIGKIYINLISSDVNRTARHEICHLKCYQDEDYTESCAVNCEGTLLGYPLEIISCN